MPIAIAPQGRELEIRKVGADEKVKKHFNLLAMGGEMWYYNRCNYILYRKTVCAETRPRRYASKK